MRASGAAVAELGQRERREVGAALAEVLFDVLRAVLEDQHGLVPPEPGQQGLAHLGVDVVPLGAVAALVRAGPGDQAADQDLGEFGRAGAGQHRPLDQLHHREAERGRREIDGQARGGRRRTGAEPADPLQRRAAAVRAGGRGGRMVGTHPAHGAGHRTGTGQQPCPRPEGHRLRRQHGHGQRTAAGLGGAGGRAHPQHGAAAQGVTARQSTEGDGQPGAVPHALRQRLEHDDGALPGQVVEQPVGVAAVPQRAGAVADQDDDPASGRIAEPVGGVQRRTVRVGAAADGRAPVGPLVQMADLDVREGSQPAEDLGQFGEQPAPHAHRGGGVQHQLQPGVPAGQVPADGQDQSASPGAHLRGGDLVELGPQGCGRTAVSLQGAQGALEFERRGQHGGGGHTHRQCAGRAGSVRTGPVAGGSG